MCSVECILQFIKPIEHLLVDPTTTDVMTDAGGRHVFVDRAGTIEDVPSVRLDEKNLRVAIKKIARICGDESSEAQPILHARLDDAHAWR